MNNIQTWRLPMYRALATAAIALPSLALAQGATPMPPHGGMHMPPHGAMQPEMPPGKALSGGMEASSGSMDMGPMQGGSPPPDARDADAHADGVGKGPLPGLDMADDDNFGQVLVNELEYVRGSGQHGQSLDAEAWYGGDLNKIWLKAEGKRSDGKLEELRTEALWDRNFATYWSSQLGVRHDTGGGPSRNWLAVGVQGLAPYWFETEAALYFGRSGAVAARGEARYDLRLTQRLRLEPKLEANLYSKADPARGIGAGLSDLQFGLRLRYEIRRQFAPYVGFTWDRKFGGTADFARAAGEPVSVRQVVAGVRMWF